MFSGLSMYYGVAISYQCVISDDQSCDSIQSVFKTVPSGLTVVISYQCVI